jgi:tetratricopeptide (TPR) repeat protein
MMLCMVFLCAVNSAVFSSVYGDVRSGNRDYQKGNYKKAVERYDRAVKKKPGWDIPLFNLGDARYREKNFKEALEDYDKIKGTLYLSKVNYNRGNIHYAMKDYEKALESYKEALRKSPEDHDAKYNLELVLRKMEEKQKNKDKDKDKDKNKDKDNKNKDKNLLLFDQILSTFKFTDKQSQAEVAPVKNPWTKYTDKDINFEIQYPENWSLRKTYGTSVNNLGNSRVSGVDITTNLSVGSTIVVNIIDPKGESLENWIKSYSGETNPPATANSTYNNLPAYKFDRFREGRPAEVLIYYMPDKKYIVFFASNTSLADQATADQILSTFVLNQK